MIRYVPAFRHYGSQVSLAHFIGSDKPWTIGRSLPQQSGSPYNQLLGQWWAVWDKHFRPVLEDSKLGNGTQHGNGNSNGFQQVYSGTPYIHSIQQEEPGKHPESATNSSSLQQQQQQHHHHNIQPFQQQRQVQQQHRPVQAFQQQRTVQPEPLAGTPRSSPAATRVWPDEIDYQHGTSFGPRNESRYAAATPKSKYVPTRPIGSQQAESQHANAQPQPLARPFHGAFPESVLTPEGPVPQVQYFETGPQSFLVQKYNASGEPVSERGQHNYDGRLAETLPGQVVYSSHIWDPAK